jgi:biotin operon repressor
MMNDLLILNFQEARQPEYREKKGAKGGYIEFGERNDYPNYLLALYNKSAKHNSIVKGKVNYIIGNGWATKEADPVAESFIKAPNEYENLNDLTRKVSIDIEIFGGAYLEIIWSVAGGNIASVCHIDYTKIRSNTDNTQFWYKKDWNDRKYEPIILNAFNTEFREGKQILYIKEYRPGLDTYALPGYMGALNYIESDIEVSRHVLGNAQTGFSASKLITLPNGEPSPDEKRNIERRFTDRFSGSDGKKFILSFTNDPARKPIIEDLGASDITKEDFSRVDAIIQQNLFSGHQITAPSLFGIAEPGKLGSRTEMRDAYEIFKSTYSNDKQQFLESIFNQLAVIKGSKTVMYIKPVEPIGFELSEAALLQIAPKEWLLEKAGIDISQYQPEVAPASAPAAEQAQVNENLKNLTGRQYQHLQRIIREFSKGKLTKEMASTMLKSGLGLNDNDVNVMLGIDEDPATEDYSFNKSLTEDEVIGLFAAYGEPLEDYEVLSRKGVFSQAQAFAEEDLIDKTKDKQLLKLIDDNPLISIDEMAKAVGKSREFVQSRVSYLIEKGAVVYDTQKQTRKLTKPLNKLVDDMEITTFEVKYVYDWKPIVPVDERDTPDHPSRTFCRRLMREQRTWTRDSIEKLSMMLGYSVFDRGGGWWGGSASCRHRWEQVTVVKKKKK